ncbi:SAYSvFN domain-containing protein 1-like [Anguilla anguilla]|uniref:SAYSvFN domain-containing protein 1-like n=1 Tax=Anguilla anguilla TaxID=7936 RepID=UPI0015AABCCB|nr:SAYSvFN domain-containing protein 1-like [Anguilla anguilla]
MEQKLAEFRARKRAMDAKDCEATGNPSKAQPELSPKSHGHVPPTNKMDKLDGPMKTESSPVIETTKSHRVIPSCIMDSAVGRWLGKTNVTLLKVLLWLVLLGLFTELGFGLPFFLISLFYWLYEGLRKPAERQPGELSAYSVFNPDCQPLLGTLTAEQLEGEMGYRPLVNR